MNTQQLLFLILLALGTMILYLLPFIPAFVEWKTKADSGPFQVNFQDRTIVDYCIRMFREYIDAHFGSLLEEYNHLNTDHEGKHVNGCEYYITGKRGHITLPGGDVSCKKTNKIILICQPSVLPECMTFNNKIYARKSLETGVNNVLNEVMAEGDIELKPGGVVSKLLFSQATITVGDRCILNGYTRALNKIHFLGHAQFQYLYAPIIEFGDALIKPPEKAVNVFLDDMPRLISQYKLVIPKRTQLVSHIVAKESLVIENDCAIKGNIKCYNDVCIENNTSIIGAIFSEKDINISSGCFIQGPIVAKGTIRIAENCVIGTRDDMTSLIAQTVIMSSGCCFSGLLLAKFDGAFK